MTTTTADLLVRCDHCDDTLTITAEISQQLAQIPAAERIKPDQRSKVAGWAILDGPDTLAFCPASFGEMLAPADTVCPDWCTLPERHTYDSIDSDGVLFRYHERRFDTVANVTVTITAGEELHPADGSRHETDPPRIYVGDHGQPMTAADALQLADQIRTAAAQLQQLAAASASTA